MIELTYNSLHFQTMLKTPEHLKCSLKKMKEELLMLLSVPVGATKRQNEVTDFQKLRLQRQRLQMIQDCEQQQRPQPQDR